MSASYRRLAAQAAPAQDAHHTNKLSLASSTDVERRQWEKFHFATVFHPRGAAGPECIAFRPAGVLGTLGNSGNVGVGHGQNGDMGDNSTSRSSSSAVSGAVSRRENVTGDFCVASGACVQLFSSASRDEVGQISKFKDPVRCVAWRPDGKLIAASGDHPLVKVFSAKLPRSQLRSLRGHTAAVRALAFTPTQGSSSRSLSSMEDDGGELQQDGFSTAGAGSVDNAPAGSVHLISGGDDRTIRGWDIETGDCVCQLKGHEDYIRTLAVSAVSPDIWVSGAYDHTVRLWDARTRAGSVMTMNHGFPVSSALVLQSGGIVVSAGGPSVRAWDILAGGKMLHEAQDHQKAITCLCQDSEGTRVLSGGLDRFVKIYDVTDFSVVHTLRYPDSILSIGLSPDSSTLAVGMLGGALSIKTRKIGGIERVQQQQKTENMRAGTYRYFLRGKNSQAAKEDFRVEIERKERLKDYDRLLKAFQYGAALDAALETRNALVVVSMLQELLRRGGLTVALSGRDEESLQPLLRFLVANITLHKHTNLLADVSEAVLDLYTPVIGHSVAVDNLLRKLQATLRSEIHFHKEMLELLGSLDLLLTASVGTVRGGAGDELNYQTDG